MDQSGLPPLSRPPPFSRPLFICIATIISPRYELKELKKQELSDFQEQELYELFPRPQIWNSEASPRTKKFLLRISCFRDFAEYCFYPFFYFAKYFVYFFFILHHIWRTSQFLKGWTTGNEIRGFPNLRSGGREAGIGRNMFDQDSWNYWQFWFWWFKYWQFENSIIH